MSTATSPEKRSTQRHKLQLPTKLTLSNGATVQARTMDISPVGLLLMSPQRLDEASMIRARLILPAEITGHERCWVNCRLEVLRCQERGQHFAVACQVRQLEVLDVEWPRHDRRIGERRTMTATENAIFSAQRTRDRRGSGLALLQRDSYGS